MVIEVKRQVCDGHQLKWLIAAGLAWLEHNMQQVNNMNVFPVPDGDTGTNMFHTMQRAYTEIAHDDEAHAGIVSEKVARGALMGARGNSGTILSQLLQGFAMGVQGQEVIDAAHFTQACRQAVDIAYKGLKEPVEGTILTVAREATESIEAVLKSDEHLRNVFDTWLQAARLSLQNTPNLLPVLKEAGVVDSGGLGLVYIAEGMQRLLDGKEVSLNYLDDETISSNGEHWQDALVPEDAEGYGYDVQFLMRGEGMDVVSIRDEIDAMGWSTLVVGDEQLIKVHVHVHNPGEPLSYAIGLGADLDDIVVENMQAQYHEYVEQRVARERDQNKQVDGVAVVTVANGNGFESLFDEYNAARIIIGGQTMNPSTEDFLAAIDSLETEEVILLPNNKNIILAAEQAAKLMREKHIRVVPSRTIPQGISALLAYGDLQENGSTLDSIYDAMLSALLDVVSCEVTRAVRDSNIDGISVREGQYIGLLDGKLVIADDELQTVVQNLLRKARTEDYELATIYYGVDVDTGQADELVSALSDQFEDIEFEMVRGGQPLYPYIISIE